MFCEIKHKIQQNHINYSKTIKMKKLRSLWCSLLKTVKFLKFTKIIETFRKIFEIKNLKFLKIHKGFNFLGYFNFSNFQQTPQKSLIYFSVYTKISYRYRNVINMSNFFCMWYVSKLFHKAQKNM